MKRRWGASWLIIALLLAGCGEEGGLAEVLPGADVLPGWAPAGEVQTFGTENLYDLVDGQADAFFAFAFEQVALQTYENGQGATVRVEVWRLGTPADAYGLFTTFRAGSPVSIGNGGDADPGRRLDFWQDQYFVRVSAVSPLDDSGLQDFAEEVAAALPVGGEPPALVARLPKVGLVENSDLFFHQEISIQSYLWLGGQNLLALGPKTDAVLARYQVGQETGWLLLVAYPENQMAAMALEALRGSGMRDLAAAEANAELLGAVFGPVTQPEAQLLLSDALDGG